MSNGSALAVAGSMAIDVVPEDRIELLRHTYGANLSHAEFDLFVHAARRLGLDPFAGQVTAVKRGGRITIQVTIDGFRAVAEKSDLYEGQTAPMWCGPDGEWREVWLGGTPPEAAKVGVYRRGFREPMIAIAAWGAYNQGNGWWSKKGGGAHMLAKCAEALALRKAFPNTLGGVYASEEMAQADAVGVEHRIESAEPKPSTSGPTPEVPQTKVAEAEWSEGDWLTEAEASITEAGWSTGDAAAILSERYKKPGEWAKWSKSRKAVTWVADRIASGEEGEPPRSRENGQPTKADVLKHAQGLKVSPKARNGIIENHFGMPLDDLPAEHYAEAFEIITDYANNEKAGN